MWEQHPLQGPHSGARTTDPWHSGYLCTLRMLGHRECAGPGHDQGRHNVLSSMDPLDPKNIPTFRHNLIYTERQAGIAVFSM